MKDGDLGKTKTYFGEVVSVSDPIRMFRCQVSINGFTDQLAPEDLPWYFPWYGIHNLPEVGDIVPVIIFDNVITSGFYANPQPKGYFGSTDDYPNYLEVFKREIENNIVSIQYSPSNGIELINGQSSVTVHDNVEIACKENKVIVDDEGIALGEGADQFIPRGDEVTQAFQDVLDQMIDVCKQFSSTSPFCMTMNTLLDAATAALGVFGTFKAPLSTLSLSMDNIITSLANLQLTLTKEKLQSNKVMSL